MSETAITHTRITAGARGAGKTQHLLDIAQRDRNAVLLTATWAESRRLRARPQPLQSVRAVAFDDVALLTHRLQGMKGAHLLIDGADRREYGSLDGFEIKPCGRDQILITHKASNTPVSEITVDYAGPGRFFLQGLLVVADGAVPAPTGQGANGTTPIVTEDDETAMWIPPLVDGTATVSWSAIASASAQAFEKWTVNRPTPTSPPAPTLRDAVTDRCSVCTIRGSDCTVCYDEATSRLADVEAWAQDWVSRNPNASAVQMFRAISKERK